AGQLRHEPEMRERCAGVAPTAGVPRVAYVGLRDETELPVAVARTLGQTGGTRREDDRNRFVVRRVPYRRCFVRDAQRGTREFDRGRAFDFDRVALATGETWRGDHELWFRDVEHRFAFALGQAIVHAGCDRTELR